MIIGNENTKLYGAWSSKVGIWFNNQQIGIWITDREELAIAQAFQLNAIDLIQYKAFCQKMQAEAKDKSRNQQGMVNMPPPPGGNGRGISGPATLIAAPLQLPTFESSMWECKEFKKEVEEIDEQAE